MAIRGYSILCLFLFSVCGQADELRVVSYNIHHGKGSDGVLDLDRQSALLKKLNADVIALQEVDRNCARSGKVDQAKYLAEKLGMSFAFGKAIDLGGGEYGLAVLAKRPIASFKVHKLPSAGEPRIALQVQLEHPSLGKYVLCNVHYGIQSEDERLKQVGAIESSLEGESLPVILLGDFNAKPKSKVIQHYQALWKGVKKAGQGMTYPAVQPKQEIDYCFYRGFKPVNARGKVLAEPVASDHRPLLNVFLFE